MNSLQLHAVQAPRAFPWQSFIVSVSRVGIYVNLKSKWKLSAHAHSAQGCRDREHRENKVKIPMRPTDNAPCQPDTESPPNVTQVQYTQVRIPFEWVVHGWVVNGRVYRKANSWSWSYRQYSLVQRLNYRRPGRNYVEKTGVKTDTKVDEYKLIP